jgi:hypothetical protein
LGTTLESEEYSETISLPARRATSASTWALLELQRQYGTCSWRRTIPHDGSEAGSHDSIQGDVEFELEADPISKSATWLQSEHSSNFSMSWLLIALGSVTNPVSGSEVMVR